MSGVVAGVGGGPWRMAPWARILTRMCFNLTFESEDDLAAIAAGMSGHGDRVEDATTASSTQVEAVASR